MKDKKLSSGISTIEATCCSMIALFCLVLAMQVCFQAQVVFLVEETATNVGHDVVSCSSLDEAEEIAEEETEDFLKGSRSIDQSSIRCLVEYAPGSDDEWEKGNFLTVEVTVKMVSPFTEGKISCTRRRLVMIERNGN